MRCHDVADTPTVAPSATARYQGGMIPATIPGRFFIMRHGETVYNATRALQSNAMHTPITRFGSERGLERA